MPLTRAFQSLVSSVTVLFMNVESVVYQDSDVGFQSKL